MRVGVLEVEPRRGLAVGLVDRVADLLEVELGDDVEGRHARIVDVAVETGPGCGRAVGSPPGRCPSGQRDLAVNQTASPTGVQIPPGPPRSDQGSRPDAPSGPRQARAARRSLCYDRSRPVQRRPPHRDVTDAGPHHVDPARPSSTAAGAPRTGRAAPPGSAAVFGSHATTPTAPFEGWGFLWRPALLGFLALVAIAVGSSFSNSPFKLEMPGDLVLRRPDQAWSRRSRRSTPRRCSSASRSSTAGSCCCVRVWIRLADVALRHPGAPIGRLGWVLAAVDGADARGRAALQPRRLQLRRAGRDGDAAPQPVRARAPRARLGPVPRGRSTRCGAERARPVRPAVLDRSTAGSSGSPGTTSCGPSSGCGSSRSPRSCSSPSRCPVLARAPRLRPGPRLRARASSTRSSCSRSSAARTTTG